MAFDLIALSNKMMRWTECIFDLSQISVETVFERRGSIYCELIISLFESSHYIQNRTYRPMSTDDKVLG